MKKEEKGSLLIYTRPSKLSHFPETGADLHIKSCVTWLYITHGLY